MNIRNDAQYLFVTKILRQQKRIKVVKFFSPHSDSYFYLFKCDIKERTGQVSTQSSVNLDPEEFFTEAEDTFVNSEVIEMFPPSEESPQFSSFCFFVYRTT